MRERSFLIAILTVGAVGATFLAAPLLADTLGFKHAFASSQEAAPAETTVDEDPRRTALSEEEAKVAAAGKLLPANVKSVLNTPGTLRHGQYMWLDEGVPEGELTIWVDLTRQMVSVFRDGHEIGTAVIVYGAKEKASPTGSFPIMRRVRDYHSRSYDAPMPYSLFITNDGVALHGSPMAANRATHGGIGLPVEFARLLFEVAEKSDMVEIVRSNPDETKRLLSSSV